MTEKMAYVIIGVICYVEAFLAIGCGATAIWKRWVWRTVGQFWEYSLEYGMKLYYPRVRDFVRNYRFIYNIVYYVFWPVMVPGQMYLSTKALRRVMSREYWY